MRLPKPSPALVLFLLSPTLGELLSGSAPPAEFFNPFGFAILASLYGSGAVIVRELKVRWKKGIGSVLLLGAAYGILEEGLMVCSFFNLGWPDLGQLAAYGRWLEFNWVWAVMLTIYHAVYSITIPIVLVELAYHDRRRERWVGNRMFNIVLGLLVSIVILGFLLFASLLNYWPPLPQYLITASTMVLLVYAAYRLPLTWGKHGEKPLPRPSIMWIIGTVATFIFFFGFWLIPNLIPFWQIGILFGPALVLFYARLLQNYDWGKPSERNRFALVAGALTFFLVFAPLQELDAARTDNPAGMSLVGLVSVAVLILLGRHVWSRDQSTHA